MRRIAQLLEEREFPAGEILARQGEPSDSLFLVLSGSISVSGSRPCGDVVTLGTFGGGAVLGELGLLTGHPRAATLRAIERSTVGVFQRTDFDRLCSEMPEKMAALIAWMSVRLERVRIEGAIAESRLFARLTPETKALFAGSLFWMELRTGEVVFREGESGEALYLIVSGRIHLAKLVEGEEKTLAELGRGDLFGEMALLTQEPRSATAYAARDTQLARLDRETFQNLLAASPQEWLGLFTAQLSQRLRASNSARGTGVGVSATRPPVGIAVVPLSAAAADFGRRLASALSVFGNTLHLTRARVEQMFSAQPKTSAAAESRLVSWLNEQEVSSRHLVLEADLAGEFENEWTARCLRQADVVLAVADGSQEIAAAVRGLRRATSSSSALAPVLVLLHNRTASHGADTAKWKAATGATRHFHVRDGNENDVGRIARSLNNKSVGLVLGGGFALGLSHIGVIEAIRSLRIPIDYVGGTSMGAVLAAACALEYSRDEMLEIMHNGCSAGLKGDYTLPVMSLLTGKKVAREIGRYLSNLTIDDFWLPFFCISASLVNTRMIVHEQGDALRSVLASCRAPAMFPPLGWGDDVLVDGGLVNNVPNDVMRERIGPGTLISVDVSQEKAFASAEAFDLHLSGWDLVRRASPFPRQKIPTLLQVLFRLISFGGIAQKQKIREYADIYLQPPNEEFNFRDFHRGEEMAQSAYPYAHKVLANWMSENGRPWSPARGYEKQV